jgi:hypothetical protein
MTPHVPLPRLAQSLAEELRHAAEIADDLQNTVALDRIADAADPSFVQSAQALDLLTQKLQALHSFVHSLCDLLPADCHIDSHAATHAITLASVKNRLCGAPACSGTAPDALEFF